MAYLKSDSSMREREWIQYVLTLGTRARHSSFRARSLFFQFLFLRTSTTNHELDELVS
jgi:hypothetical protein